MRRLNVSGESTFESVSIETLRPPQSRQTSIAGPVAVRTSVRARLQAGQLDTIEVTVSQKPHSFSNKAQQRRDRLHGKFQNESKV